MADTLTRLSALADALDVTVPGEPSRKTLEAAVAQAIVERGTSAVWLALGALRSELPTQELVIATARRFTLESPAAVVRDIADHPVRRAGRGSSGVRPVRILRGAVIVDVHHTARTGLATGIQRVVRKTIEIWASRHEIVLVGWGSTYGGLRELSEPERQNALHGTNPHAPKPKTGEVTIPWESTYILPELAIEGERTARISAMAEFSGNATAAIGFDCVPLTSADTVSPGMGGVFAKTLCAVARMDKVSTISIAAATEYLGWRDMLGGAGMSGPDIREIILPTDSEAVSNEALDSARQKISTGDLPIVLCVGSHEPRKNHLAVLAAAEQLWSRGRQFSLVFIGGNSWGGHGFEMELARLQREGRPVSTISAVTDDLLWSAYRIAACTVFPSLNEGYGLPVAESLAVGTPVVTSDFGSMREITASGGAILVNPRDEDGIAVAIEAAVFNEETNERLREEALKVPRRTWDDYAVELWSYFTDAKI